jgi:hypothetical protein
MLSQLTGEDLNLNLVIRNANGDFFLTKIQVGRILEKF